MKASFFVGSVISQLSNTTPVSLYVYQDRGLPEPKCIPCQKQSSDADMDLISNDMTLLLDYLGCFCNKIIPKVGHLSRAFYSRRKREKKNQQTEKRNGWEFHS